MQGSPCTCVSASIFALQTCSLTSSFLLEASAPSTYHPSRGKSGFEVVCCKLFITVTVFLQNTPVVMLLHVLRLAVCTSNLRVTINYTLVPSSTKIMNSCYNDLWETSQVAPTGEVLISDREAGRALGVVAASALLSLL